MKIYVGNLSYNTTEEELREEFEAFGDVASVSLVTDRETGRPRGFAFVEMSSAVAGQEAITSMNGRMLKERAIVVNEAKPRTDNRSSSGGGYGNRESNYGNRRSGGGSRGFGGKGFGGGRENRY